MDTCQSCCKEFTKYHKHLSCENDHKSCNDCYMDLFYEATQDGGKQAEIQCTQCEATLLPIKPKVSGHGEHVFIYVDDSNMWIEAKKLAARQGNFKCVEDPRLRMDMGKVAEFVSKGREIACHNLYGSEPPPRDTVWEKMKQCGWKVKLSKRSLLTNKEKQVDHRIVKDITALVSDRSVAKGTIILVSGDADLIPAIEEGLSKKWSFEIWMWASGISNALKKHQEEHPESLKIGSLDPHLQDISFTHLELSKKQLSSAQNSRTAVIKNFEGIEGWQKDLTEKLRWPFQFCWKGQDIVLVFSPVKPKDEKTEFAYHFDKIFELLQREYPGRVVNSPAYRQKESYEREKISLANKYEALEDVREQPSLGNDYDFSDKGENEVQGHPSEGKKDNDSISGNEFQLVQTRKQSKKNQKFSDQCPYRSKCRNGINCTYWHTRSEKKYFQKGNYNKHKECKYKNNCCLGTACTFAHSQKDSFCRKCHLWGHLQNKCTVETPVQSSSTTK